MNEPQKESEQQLLAFASRKAAHREGYIASYLARYQQQENLSEEALRKHLGCTRDAYTRLALCRTPVVDSKDFGQRIGRIASVTGITASRLADIILQVAHLQAIQEEPAALLLAARDRDEQEGEEDDGA